MMRRLFAFLFIALLAFAACSTGAPQQAQAPTATLATIVSLTPRFTATPVASRTPLPTFTYTPSDTPIPPTPSDTPTPTEVPPVRGVIQSRQTVNVREGPGTNFSALTALAPGTGVEVLGESADGAWINILMADGSEGWVSSTLLFIQPTQTAIPTFTPTIDRTAIALGTAFPTAILGGAPVSPTPPASALLAETDEAGADVDATAAPAGTQVIDLSAFNMTATALVDSITGGATANAGSTRSSNIAGPVGGPTGGPIGGPTPTLGPGAGRRGSGSAQEGVDVLAYCDNPLMGLPAPRNLEPGATIDIYWSWYARTREQLQQHIENVIYEVAIDGNRLSNWRLYAAGVTQQNDNNWYQYWFVPYGPLTAGEHVITYRVTWREAISDGYQQYGPGTNTPFEEGSCTFRVG